MTYGLIMQRGPMVGEAFALRQSVVIVGRDASADFVIADPLVSRRHAKLAADGDAYFIEDLNSTNGTLVNTQRISGPVQLVPGDVIDLGKSVTLSFEDIDTEYVTILAIDKARREEQIAEITDQEYFQDLQAKVKKYRRKSDK